MTLAPAGFLVNDPDYAPFGWSWLRGITPARLGLVAVVTLIVAYTVTAGVYAARGFAPMFERPAMTLWMRFFLASIPLFVLLVKADLRTADAPPRARVKSLVVAVLVGAVAAGLINAAAGIALGIDWRRWPLPHMIPAIAYNAMIFGSVFAAVLYFARRERDAVRRLQQGRLERLAAERHDAEAQLQVLHAQIEPHFLFNSLANVKRLYETGAEGGRDLMRGLGQLLRRAVASGEQREATLAQEVEIVRGLLDVMRLRMGDRLRSEIEVEPGVGDALIPPLILGTLVENAVKHGIGPRASGGLVRVAARRDGERVVVEVSDNGVGFRAESGTGVGLANSRARLASVFGGAAQLKLSRNPEGGVTTRVVMPYRASEERKEADGSVQPVEGFPEVPSAGHAGFLARAWRHLTWKHWAWATAIGVGFPALQRPIRLIVSPTDQLGWMWVEETFWITVFAYLFMAAIVLAEASQKGKPGRSSARFAVGAAAATVICLLLAWSFPIQWIPRQDPNPGQAAMIQNLMSHPGFDLRRASVIQTGAHGALIGCLATALYVWLRNARLAAAALAAAELARAEAAGRAAAARLESTRTEIDPDSVFEALDEIEQLYETDRANADAMLDELIAFLRAAIPKVRSIETEPAAAPAAAIAI